MYSSLIKCKTYDTVAEVEAAMNNQRIVGVELPL